VRIWKCQFVEAAGGQAGSMPTAEAAVESTGVVYGVEAAPRYILPNPTVITRRLHPCAQALDHSPHRQITTNDLSSSVI
jgi:hypothetical protein